VGDDLYYFDSEAADRVCRFFQTQLVHWKGKHAGKPFVLLDWQRRILQTVFGTKRQDGTRRYRTVYIELPRKNGKTFFLSGILLYLLCADSEPGAEVYASAATASQSNIALDNCKKMVQASPALRKRLDVKQYRIEHPKSQSVLRNLSGEQVGSHGKNISGLGIDEFHEWTSPSSESLYEALTTSMGARSQPLTVIITTAGYGGDETLCLQAHQKATRYISGEAKPDDADFDDTFHAVVYGVDKDRDWTDPRVWSQANPSLGYTFEPDYLETECRKAKESPAKQNTFRRLYLNQWTEQATRWLDLKTFDSCSAAIDPTELDGSPCYIGLDLSQSFDFTAAVTIYPQPEKWVVIPRLYMPKEIAQRRQHDDGTPIPDWIDKGYVIGTEGGTTDFDRIEADLMEQVSRGPVVEVAFDPYMATGITRHLEAAGVTAVPVYQSFIAMNAASKEFERRLTSKQIAIADNPAFRWMIANVEVQTDRHGNIMPSKPKRRGQYAGTRSYSIDGVVATIIAISRAMLRDNVDTDNAPCVVFI
jgi:phage terminase large subunit-like protein